MVPHRNAPSTRGVLRELIQVGETASRLYEQLDRTLLGLRAHVEPTVEIRVVATDVPNLEIVQGDDGETPALRGRLVPAHSLAVLQFPPAMNVLLRPGPRLVAR